MICQIDITGNEKVGPPEGDHRNRAHRWVLGRRWEKTSIKAAATAQRAAQWERRTGSDRGGGPWGDEQSIWPITWSGFGATRVVCLCPLHIINTVWTHTTIRGKYANWFGQKSSVLERSEQAQVWKRPESPFSILIHLWGAESLNREPLTPVKRIIAFYLFHLAFLSNRAC